jgi:hypothetical protein
VSRAFWKRPTRESELNTAAANLIANPDDTTEYYIHVSARTDGSFVVQNARNAHTKEYKPRR